LCNNGSEKRWRAGQGKKKKNDFRETPDQGTRTQEKKQQRTTILPLETDAGRAWPSKKKKGKREKGVRGRGGGKTSRATEEPRLITKENGGGGHSNERDFMKGSGGAPLVKKT